METAIKAELWRAPVLHCDETGVILHAGWAEYHVYTACRQALRNVHHLRELTFLELEIVYTG